MIAAVYDCVIYVQAALSRKGPAFACLSLAEAEHVRLCISPNILEEVKRTLDQPALRKRYVKITDESVAEFLDYLESISTISQDAPTLFVSSRDPKDERYINLAIETSSPFVVSRDLDLLDLMKDKAFRTKYPRITVLEPVAFLKHVRAEVAKELGYE
jgi:putative PIN family toxin of toxin-antitoxin system